MIILCSVVRTKINIKISSTMSLDSYYLGFDLSTQQLKCLAIDQNLKIVHSETVEFEKELSHYHTKKGVYIHGDTIECPVAMWLEAVSYTHLDVYKRQSLGCLKLDIWRVCCLRSKRNTWKKEMMMKLRA